MYLMQQLPDQSDGRLCIYEIEDQFWWKGRQDEDYKLPRIINGTGATAVGLDQASAFLSSMIIDARPLLNLTRGILANTARTVS